MRWGDVIELASSERTRDEYGQPINSNPILRQVFANKKSVRQTEFYQAMAAGLKPEVVFEIREFEYNNETDVKYQDVMYEVIRTYSRNGEILELVCSKYPLK